MDHDAVVAAAWDVVRERGLLGLTLDELADRVGTSAEELTHAFASLHAVYDALFADAQRTLRDRYRCLPDAADPREALRLWIHAYARFAAEDPVRWQLLAQRVVPDFEPSPGTYAIAVDSLERLRALLGAVEITEPAHLDLLTGLVSGIVSQQLANEPGGDRWLRLIDDALDMFLDTREVRRRLVAAQDRERRRIERDLHDGVQQHLVALKIAASTARTIAEREGATQTVKLLESFADDASVALETLRELARGIYPPLLAAEGIGAALTAAASRAPMPVEIVADRIDRYGDDVEAAVYFCCLEALQNVAKYAGASKAKIVLDATDRALVFEVVDDGVGFDPATTPRGSGTVNMADRVAALGGTLVVDSAVGAGTTVTGRIPITG